MNNSEEFIDFYNKIDKFIKESEDVDSNKSFSSVINNSKNKAVNKYQNELISLGRLRNAISHIPLIGHEPIAIPHFKAVQFIKELHREITEPQKVIPTFAFEVLGAKEDDNVNHILVEMKNRSFSQFPVYDLNNHVIEIINTNTISRWISERLEENGTVLIENIKVKDLIQEIEFSKNYEFISRDTSVYEAYNLFLNHILTKGRNLDVLFITDSGTNSEKLLGLITIEDIVPKVQKLASYY